MKLSKFTFECDQCHAETEFSYGYCMDDEPWSDGAKWLCGKCYKDTKPERAINRRGTEVGERST